MSPFDGDSTTDVLSRYSPFWGWVRSHLWHMIASAIVAAGTLWTAATAYGQLQERVQMLEARDVELERRQADQAEERVETAVAKSRLDAIDRHLEYEDSRMDQMERAWGHR